MTWPQQFSFVLDVVLTCMTGHIIILSHLHHRPHAVQLVLIVQQSILQISYRYDWSHHCLIYFSWSTSSYLIGHDISIPISRSIAPVRSVTPLSYLVFIIDRTLLDLSSQFTFVFGVKRTYTTDHVNFLSCLCHKPHTVLSILIV